MHDRPDSCGVTCSETHARDLRTASGGDDLKGDEGWDTADYAGRPEALTIDLDDRRDDGATGEGDNARTTVEAEIGGAAGDKLTGSAASNYL